mmetsp:Transcript_11647/g.32877  ORF Transcript_11647/g.32877 Transcript_11647/m.32877 type:complete len:210 (-) Transcript_11647:1271-1900(-)
MAQEMAMEDHVSREVVGLELHRRGHADPEQGVLPISNLVEGIFGGAGVGQLDNLVWVYMGVDGMQRQAIGILPLPIVAGWTSEVELVHLPNIQVSRGWHVHVHHGRALCCASMQAWCIVDLEVGWVHQLQPALVGLRHIDTSQVNQVAWPCDTEARQVCLHGSAWEDLYLQQDLLHDCLADPCHRAILCGLLRSLVQELLIGPLMDDSW